MIDKIIQMQKELSQGNQETYLLKAKWEVIVREHALVCFVGAKTQADHKRQELHSLLDQLLDIDARKESLMAEFFKMSKT